MCIRDSNMGKIILTGDRPTGKLHIGHYVGSLRRRVELQNSGEFDEIYIMIADAQDLTDNADNPEKVRQNIIEAVSYTNLPSCTGVKGEKDEKDWSYLRYVLVGRKLLSKMQKNN